MPPKSNLSFSTQPDQPAFDSGLGVSIVSAMQGMKEHLYDRRIVRRNMERGLLEMSQYEKHIAGLSDAEHLIAPPEERVEDEESSEA